MNCSKCNQQMSYILMAIIIVLFAGCHRTPESDTGKMADKSDDEIKDGGNENPKRDKAQEYFNLLTKVRSPEEEEKLLKDFAHWLNSYEYKISVVEEDGVHHLSCPYFPPVTPWLFHKFFDVKNLNLLPLMEDKDSLR